jgi:DNA-binding response OmpR family regulator
MSASRNAGGRGPTFAPTSPMAVLFVDPDMEGAERLARALPNLSAFAVVPTAQAALSAIAVRVPDLVVSEIDLPDGNGVQLLARIHGAAATRRVLLMVLTHRATVRDKIAAFQAGADDFLVKPVDADQLATHVRLVSRFRQVTSN